MDPFSNDTKIFDENAEILKALAHPIRLCIVQGLISCNGCNVSKIQNCLDIPQSTISQHLAKLRSSGIIAGERNGLEIVYKVVNPKAKAIVNAIVNN
ncbi:metalloregulator ArsR/SmtB family transcription factor [Alkaliphilus sp. MSJ-5]|uniref:Metalloregulator ArsR/SmtB family transcription factor n=1 Tax=Alkaliphilus flagellatus TaxID=2841507 RepID=A0ABS6FYP8_9FIRM|nr:metalloregulator ArsR/SmtB family transcription factor [Alkaliphilus flagellatus]MBU5675367.1 metalloregulator ArsR/SmtB family transcription factor [Alkaliphilus flagellatus]